MRIKKALSRAYEIPLARAEGDSPIFAATACF